MTTTTLDTDLADDVEPTLADLAHIDADADADADADDPDDVDLAEQLLDGVVAVDVW